MTNTQQVTVREAQSEVRIMRGIRNGSLALAVGLPVYEVVSGSGVGQAVGVGLLFGAMSAIYQKFPLRLARTRLVAARLRELGTAR